MANKKKQKRVQKALEAQAMQALSKELDKMSPDVLRALLEELRNDPDIEFEPEQPARVSLQTRRYPSNYDNYYGFDDEEDLIPYYNDIDYENGSDEDPYSVTMGEEESEIYIEQDINIGPNLYYVNNPDPAVQELIKQYGQALSYTVNGDTKEINTYDVANYVYDNDYDNCYKLNFVEELVITDEGLPVLPLSAQTPEFIAEHRDQPGFHLIQVAQARALLLEMDQLASDRDAAKKGHKPKPINTEGLIYLVFLPCYEIELNRKRDNYELRKYGTHDPDEIYRIRREQAIARRDAALAEQRAAKEAVQAQEATAATEAAAQ